jgi:formate-dependent nitrite reductase membrane component NrfD
MEALISFALAYLWGLALIGYFSVWFFVQRVAEQRRWANSARYGVVGAHFVLGVVAILVVPSIVLFRIGDEVAEESKIIFATAGFFALVASFVIVRSWEGTRKSERET